MKRTCPCCQKKFVYNKKRRREAIRENWLPEGTETYCEPCIRCIASIEAEIRESFWEQSLPLSEGCGGFL